MTRTARRQSGSLASKLAKRKLLLLSAGLVVLCLAGYYFWFGPRAGIGAAPAPRREATNTAGNSASQDNLSAARQALEGGDYATAERLTDALLSSAPPTASVLLVAAQAQAQLGNIGQAIALCDRCPQDGSPEAEVAAWVPCELLMRSGQLTQAIARLERLLRSKPAHTEARQRLIYALGLSGQGRQAREHLIQLMQQGHVDAQLLSGLGLSHRMIDAREELEQLAKQAAQDAAVQLGLARLDLAANQASEAQSRLVAIVQSNPEMVEAWARLGEARLRMLQAASPESRSSLLQAYEEWDKALPKAAEEHPEIWFLRGSLAATLEDREASAGCYWQAIRRDPNYSQALYMLGQTLLTLGRSSQAQPLLDRHLQLKELERSLDQLPGKRLQAQQAIDLARRNEALQNDWEAWGWYQLAFALNPGDSAVAAKLQLLKGNLQSTTGKPDSAVLLGMDPSAAAYLESLPRAARPRQNVVQTSPSEMNTANIHFVDMAKEVGIDFNYFCSPTPGVEGKYLYEFAGGGIAVVDLDLDGWPDLYLTQGCPWPPGAQGVASVTSTTTANALYRNLSGERFVQVPAEKAAADTGFGQGATIGDFNSDGFPDIYVANIGPNRLYVNNGDGTFSDATSLLGQELHHWTTSCVMADLNADGHPDIYDVNYLSGQDLFSRICVWPQNKRRICGPATFQPARDQLLLNQGEDGFANASQESASQLPAGNGLGVIAANFLPYPDQQAVPLQLFVANDQQPNFLFQWDALAEPRAGLRDEAVLMGLALDSQGAAQACMGVAAGDADEDGQLDLFITNYYHESNALYIQQTPGFFAEQAAAAQLREPSYALLGFGTQFVDADLDGRQDLVLTNGHLDDFSYLQQPYQMPPQFFYNQGNARFSELKGTLGPYFDGLYRGRSLARLDWNRDGREDFIVSHLDAAVALLTNDSRATGNFLALELRGVQSTRDAIGSLVTLQLGERRLVRQLCAGDGYQASNQRQLIFGVAHASQVEQLSIRWPSGTYQEFPGPIATNHAYILVEGGQLEMTHSASHGK